MEYTDCPLPGKMDQRGCVVCAGPRAVLLTGRLWKGREKSITTVGRSLELYSFSNTNLYDVIPVLGSIDCAEGRSTPIQDSPIQFFLAKQRMHCLGWSLEYNMMMYGLLIECMMTNTVAWGYGMMLWGTTSLLSSLVARF